MLDITEMMYESLDALTNNSSSTPTTPTTPITPITPITPMTPMTPMTPITPTTPIIPIHYNPSKILSPYNIPPSPSYISHEIEIIQPNDNRSRRHFKIIGDTASNILPDNERSGRRNRHLSQVSSTSTASSSDFSTLTINTLNSTMSTSPSPTLHDVDSYCLDDLAFEKLINFDQNNNSNTDDYNTGFDVIINVGEEPYIKRFRGHSAILSKRSSYFRSAFSKCFAKKHGEVYLFDKPNMSPKVFTAILRYIYFGSIKLERLDMSTILDLLIASDELALEDFTSEIQTYFIHLNSDWLKTKIVPILQCCYSNPTSFSKLLLHTSTMIKKDPTCLLIQNNLYLLSELIMNNILNECYNGLDDWAIWQCILTWALGQENINEFPCDVKKWRQYEFNMLHELISKLVESYVRFSHISRNYFLDKVLPYLNYWIRDNGSKVGEDANEETVLYYLSNHHHNHITHHNNTYTNHHASSSSTSTSSTSIILEDSALINHIHALKITCWIQEENNVIDTTNNSFKSKKFNSHRFALPFFRKKNRQQQNSNFISTALSISTHILTSTKSSTTHQQQQQQQSYDIKSTPTPAAYQFNLLFRMSRDGASAYHDRCMNQGPTLVIAKIKLPSSSSNNKYILVGGYNPIGFNYFSNSNNENNLTSSSSPTLVFTFGDGKSFEKRDMIRMMISDDNCTKDCSKNFKSTPTKTPLSMKKPLFSAKVNNLSSISINNHNRFDNGTAGLCFGNNLIINFHEKSVEFNGGQEFGLIKSDLYECEIFQVKELCY